MDPVQIGPTEFTRFSTLRRRAKQLDHASASMPRPLPNQNRLPCPSDNQLSESAKIVLSKTTNLPCCGPRVVVFSGSPLQYRQSEIAAGAERAVLRIVQQRPHIIHARLKHFNRHPKDAPQQQVASSAATAKAYRPKATLQLLDGMGDI